MSKRFQTLLFLVLGLFVCLLLMLCYFNRLATDDYYFIWDVRNHGIITGVSSQYMEWCGRFAATFAMDVFYYWFDVNHVYYSFIPFASALLLFIGLYFLTSNIGNRLELSVTKSQRLLISGTFTALLFFLSVDIGESWFWFCGLSSYLWSIIAFVWACVFLTNTNRLVFSTIAAAFCFIYIGGASEVYSVIYGVFFTVFLLIKYKEAQDVNAFITSNKRLLLIYTLFATSFLIFLIAPGNYMRDGLFPEHQFWYSFFITAKSFVKFGIFYLPSKLPYIILFGFPFLWLGDELKEHTKGIFNQSFKSFFFKLSGVFILALFVFFFLVAFVMVETGPPRIWLFVSFMSAIYFSILFFYAGCKDSLSYWNKKNFTTIILSLGIVLLVFSIITQYVTASTYSKANDERISYLLDLNKTITNDTLILLSPLPPSGMLYSTEISVDTSHFTNKELRLGYDLKFHVALKR